MIIRGQKVQHHYWIPCLLVCPNNEVIKPLELVVDTGATTTTVFSEYIGMDCNGLACGVEVLTANGPQIPHTIRNVILLFRTSKEKIYPVELDAIDVVEIENPPIAGLLGMDVLSKFRIHLTPRYVTLKK